MTHDVPPLSPNHVPTQADDATRPPMFQALDLATAHLPKHLGEDGLDQLDHVTAYALPHGWLLHVPEDPQKWADDHEIPAEVLAVQLYAHRWGCRWIMFDDGGDRVDELPEWEW